MRNQNKVFHNTLSYVKLNSFIKDVTKILYSFHRPLIEDGLDTLLYTSSLRVHYFR